MFEPLNFVIGTAWIVSGLSCLGLSLPLIAKRVGPNSLYGVRFPESFQSDEAWYAINRFGGLRLAWWSAPQLVWGIVSLFLPLDDQSIWTVVLGAAPIAFVLIPAFESWRFARRFRAS